MSRAEIDTDSNLDAVATEHWVVPVRSCRRPDPDPRDRSDPAYIQYRDGILRADIRKRGIQQPLLGYEDGEFVAIIDGGTRLEVARLDQMDTVPVCVWAEKPSARLRKAMWLANEMRRDFTPAERSRFSLDTMRQEGWTLSQLCREMGLNQPTVYKRIAWLPLVPEDLHGKVGDGEGMIPERAAYALKNYPPEERRAVCERVMAGAIKVESMETKRKKPKRDKLESDGVEINFPRGLATAVLTEIVRQLLGKLK